MKDAVYAVPDPEGTLIGLEMNVTGSFFNSIHEYCVHKSDDRRFFRRAGQFFDVIFILFFLDDIHRTIISLFDLIDYLFDTHRVSCAVVFAYSFRDPRFRCDDRLDAQACSKPDVLNHVQFCLRKKRLSSLL
ncbi:hypothetical protein ES703_69992 [subsurface metagenome]